MSRFSWAASNLIALFRVNLLNRINLWDWLDKPFAQPPPDNEISQPFLPGLCLGQHQGI
jgi:hypothetical protein